MSCRQGFNEQLGLGFGLVGWRSSCCGGWPVDCWLAFFCLGAACAGGAVHAACECTSVVDAFAPLAVKQALAGGQQPRTPNRCPPLDPIPTSIHRATQAAT